MYIYLYLRLMLPWVEHCLPWINIRHLNIYQETTGIRQIPCRRDIICPVSHLDVASKGDAGRVPLRGNTLAVVATRKPRGLSIELRTFEVGSIQCGCSTTRAGRGWVTLGRIVTQPYYFYGVFAWPPWFTRPEAFPAPSEGTVSCPPSTTELRLSREWIVQSPRTMPHMELYSSDRAAANYSNRPVCGFV